METSSYDLIENNTIDGGVNGILYGIRFLPNPQGTGSDNNIIRRNKILNASSACIAVDDVLHDNNTFYLNNLSNCTVSAQSSNTANFFNSTFGNFWPDLNASNFTDSDGDGFYDSGPGWPYNKSNAVDYRPCRYYNCLGLANRSPTWNGSVSSQTIFFSLRSNSPITATSITVKVNGAASAAFSPTSCVTALDEVLGYLANCTYMETGLATGNNSLTVAATDGDGVSGSLTLNFTCTANCPPAPVTGLAAVGVNTTAINWTWTNPANADFNHVEAYVDGVFVGNLSNTTASYVNSTFAASTSHTLSLRTVNNAGTVNATWTNLTAATQAPTPAPASGGGGGGGGGCCGSAPVEAKAGEPVAFDLPPSSPLGALEAVPDEPGPVRASVKPLAAPPPGAPPLPGPVFGLMEVALMGPAGPVKAKSAAMEFKVARTALAENGVPEERVALAGMEGKEWKPYPAKKVGESPAEVRFRAEVPGLSVFAITAAPLPPSPSPAQVPSPSPEAPPTSGPSVQPPPAVLPPMPTPRQPGFEAWVAVSALVAAGWLRMLGPRR